MFKNTMFQAKCAEIIAHQYRYKPLDMQRPIRMQFKAVCKMILDRGGNEYDAAIFFMLSLREQLSDDPRHEELKQFWWNTSAWICDYANLDGTRDLLTKSVED